MKGLKIAMKGMLAHITAHYLRKAHGSLSGQSILKLSVCDTTCCYYCTASWSGVHTVEGGLTGHWLPGHIYPGNHGCSRKETLSLDHISMQAYHVQRNWDWIHWLHRHTVVSWLLVPIAHCTVQALTWSQCWNGGVSHESRWCIVSENQLFHYCNHMIDCSVQCAIGAVNLAMATPCL